MGFFIPLILQTSQSVLSILRETKQRTRGWEPIKFRKSYNLFIWIFVDPSLRPLEMVNNILFRP